VGGASGTVGSERPERGSVRGTRAARCEEPRLVAVEAPSLAGVDGVAARLPSGAGREYAAATEKSAEPIEIVPPNGRDARVPSGSTRPRWLSTVATPHMACLMQGRDALRVRDRRRRAGPCTSSCFYENLNSWDAVFMMSTVSEVGVVNE